VPEDVDHVRTWLLLRRVPSSCVPHNSARLEILAG
jgi:hypothetical protein